MTNQEFIDQVAVYVKKYAAIFGICVHSPIIAQAILESGWGKSKLAATGVRARGCSHSATTLTTTPETSMNKGMQVNC